MWCRQQRKTGLQSPRDKSRSFKSRTRDGSRSFCPGHPISFTFFSKPRYSNKAFPQANLAGSSLLCTYMEVIVIVTQQITRIAYAPIADHNRVHKDVSHALAVSHVVGLQDSARDLSRVDSTSNYLRYRLISHAAWRCKYNGMYISTYTSHCYNDDSQQVMQSAYSR